jgi:hypothetical protein
MFLVRYLIMLHYYNWNFSDLYKTRLKITIFALPLGQGTVRLIWLIGKCRREEPKF